MFTSRQHEGMRPFSLLLLLFATSGFASSVGIITTTVPNGTVGTAYSAVVNATGGCTPYVWALASGKLPAGITTKVSSTTKSLTFSGTPKTAGTYSFTEDVAGCGGTHSKMSYKIVVQATANHVVDLSWKRSITTNVVGYNVYRGPDGVTWKKINPSLIGSSLYSDSTVANKTTYCYSATAVDVNGRESVKTAAVKAVVP
jgi:hypothetical protein